MSFRLRLGWVTLFAVAFGYLEAAVVVYLREVLYPEGFSFPLRLLPTRLGLIELGRELSTLVMLLGSAALAGRGFWPRFGAFAVAFGVWDLVYYVALRAMVGWPESLATWDVLFLIPGIWTGPVSSAAGIASLLVICGAWMWRHTDDGWRPATRPWHVAAALGSLTLLLASFLANHAVALAGAVPARFPWVPWTGGVGIGLAAFGDLFLRRPRMP